MRKLDVIVLLVLLTPLLMMNFEGVDATFISAQGNPRVTGELLSDPNLTTEPIVEIGYSSPEFSYTYNIPDDSIDLIWTHTPGYMLSYSYDPYVPYQQCNEFARIRQDFDWEYNQTPVTMKVSAFFKIECTGEFATNEHASEMYSVDFWLGSPWLSAPYRIKATTDLVDGETYHIEFLISNYEAEGIFGGAGVPGTFILYVGLIPTYLFSAPYGGALSAYEAFDGSVTATIFDISVNGLLEVDSIVPEKITPRYNTTTLWNESYHGLGIESFGQDSLVHLSEDMYSYPYNSVTIGKLRSDHSSVWNHTPSFGVAPTAAIDLQVEGNNLYILGSNQTVGGGDIMLMKMGSQGTELWTSSFSVYGLDYPLYFDVAPTGRIYILSLSTRQPSVGNLYSFEILYNLICTDAQGDFLWNQTVLVQSYEEYIYAVFTNGLTLGVGCSGSDIYLGIGGNLYRYGSSGNMVWHKTYDFQQFCGDPAGGFYTAKTENDGIFQLAKWNAAGTIAWSRTMDIDYGFGWKDYPLIQTMKVGPNGYLYSVLDYTHIESIMTIAKLSRTGQVLARDPIHFYLTEYWYYSRPIASDLAVTTDGLVHVAFSTLYSYPYYISNPFYPYPADTLVAYELSGVPIFTVRPESLVITGAATLLIGAIAWDHFIRGRTRPEDVLPVQEEIDPWKILMEKAEDE
ncbi:MAG: hypothetical protein ACFFE1_10540 [Candidatus Thorarchaeota archaeon]